MRGSRLNTALTILLLLGLAAVPVFSALTGQTYWLTLFARAMIFGLAALGLNLILGYGGLVSFGHALYLGIGAYAVGILQSKGVSNGFIHFAAAIGVSASVACVIGLVCLRTSGMAFIMITLAFAQMGYFLAVSLKAFGGDDGLSIPARSQFEIVTWDNPFSLYLSILLTLAITILAYNHMIKSRFGMVLRGAKLNRGRTEALGIPALRYMLLGYVVSAVICAIAGVFLANLTRYVSPSYMQWTISGELIVMCVLGGLATVIGPVIGAFAIIFLEDVLTTTKLGLPGNLDELINSHWLALLGVFIVIVTLGLRQGIYGVIQQRIQARA